MLRKVTILLINFAILILNIVSIKYFTEPICLYLFRQYTYCSVLLAMVNAIFIIFFIFKNIKINKKLYMPKCLYLFCYTVAVCLALTFIVVITVLIPLYGKGGVDHYLTNNISAMTHHALTPLFGILTFILIRKYNSLSIKDIFIPIIFTIIYSIIIFTLNAMRIIDGPYKFFKIYEQPIYMTIFWVFCLLSVNILLAWLIYKMSICYENEK